MPSNSEEHTTIITCGSFISNPIQHFNLSNVSSPSTSTSTSTSDTSFRAVRLLDIPTESVPLYDKRVSGSGGRGLFTIQPLTKGDCIIVENPYLVLPLSEDGDEPDNSTYHRLYDSLSMEMKLKFRRLHMRNDEMGDRDDVVNKIDTNAIPLPEGGEVRRMGLFEIISTVNHSCVPNAGWYWYEEDQEMRLYAYTDIPAHQEITCSYLSYDQLLGPSPLRRSILLEGFGFECICEGCNRSSIDILKSDYRLEEYRSLRNEWTNKNILEYCKVDDDLSKTLLKLSKSLKILKEEKKFNQLGEVYEKIFEVVAIHGHYELSKSAAKDALDHFKAIMGERQALKTSFAVQVVHPTVYPHWNRLGAKEHENLENIEEEEEEEEKSEDSDGREDYKRSKSREWDEKSYIDSD